MLFFEDVPLVESVYLVFTRMPGQSCCRPLRPWLLCLCDVFWPLMNSLACGLVSCFTQLKCGPTNITRAIAKHALFFTNITSCISHTVPPSPHPPFKMQEPTHLHHSTHPLPPPTPTPHNASSCTYRDDQALKTSSPSLHLTWPPHLLWQQSPHGWMLKPVAGWTEPWNEHPLNLRSPTVTLKGHFLNRCDIYTYKVVKAVHGNQSASHCNQSDTQPHGRLFYY